MCNMQVLVLLQRYVLIRVQMLSQTPGLYHSNFQFKLKVLEHSAYVQVPEVKLDFHDIWKP